jgi:hypothetical protein
VKHYTKRAQDALDLVVVVDVYLSRIKTACKGAVAHSAQRQVERLKASKLRLERELVELQAKAVGLFSWFKVQGQVRELKRKLAEINGQIVNWINSVYRYFVVA